MVSQLIFLSTTIQCRTKTGKKKICTESKFKCSAIIYGDDIHLMSSIYDTVCQSFYGFVEICRLQFMQVYSLKQCQELATEIILNLWQSP